MRDALKRRWPAHVASRTLDALASGIPLVAFLFDANGRLVWMSAEGARRLSLASPRARGRVGRGSDVLDRLWALAVELSSGDAPSAARALRPSWIHAGERLTAQRFDRDAPALVLLRVEAASREQPRLGGRTGAIPALGFAESRVVRLAAEGYAVVNIAATLGISEATVRTHLRRAYAKLGVHNRAELACAVIREDAGGGMRNG